MDLKQIAKDTAKVLASYLTYRAVRVIVSQLSETNPALAIWLNSFSSTGKIQDGETYLQELLQENQQLALRVMTVREHLATEVSSFLPEMTLTAIAQANMEHRRQHLERMTQLQLPPIGSATTPEALENPTDSDNER